MTQIKTALVAFIGAGVFTFLFYRESLGLNLLIFEWLVLAVSAPRVFKDRHFMGIFAFAALFLSSLFVVITHSFFSHTMNIITFFLFIGTLAFPQLKVVSLGVLNGMISLISSQSHFLKSFKGNQGKGNAVLYKIKRLRFYLIPILLFLLFILFYRVSNPTFEKWVSAIQEHLPSLHWLEDINLIAVITFIWGLAICNTVLFPAANFGLIASEKQGQDDIKRKRKRFPVSFKNLALKNEYQSALFLFGGLNIFLFVLNVMDIQSVWFNFKWEGDTLKSFVHQGTSALIASILISMLLVLYYFRNNINFYAKNTWLKRLALFWLAQNIVLCISVVIRNLHYIKYFSLAHLRIGLFIFLAITVVGLITIMIKVIHKKSFFYLLRVNTLIGFAIILLCSFVDWDMQIARYNVNHTGRSYYHLSYMCGLADKTLPIVDLNHNELLEFDHYHEQNYSSIRRTMSPDEYLNKIDSRKRYFIEDWEQTSWKSWNLADSKAYSKLSQ